MFHVSRLFDASSRGHESHDGDPLQVEILAATPGTPGNDGDDGDNGETQRKNRTGTASNFARNLHSWPRFA